MIRFTVAHVAHKLEIPNCLGVDHHSSLYGGVTDAQSSGRVPDIELHLRILKKGTQSRKGVISAVFVESRRIYGGHEQPNLVEAERRVVVLSSSSKASCVINWSPG